MNRMLVPARGDAAQGGEQAVDLGTGQRGGRLVEHEQRDAPSAGVVEGPGDGDGRALRLRRASTTIAAGSMSKPRRSMRGACRARRSARRSSLADARSPPSRRKLSATSATSMRPRFWWTKRSPALAGGGRRAEVEGHAGDLGDGARVGPVVAGEDLDDRRLAAAVRADEGVDLAAARSSSETSSSARWPANVLDTLDGDERRASQRVRHRFSTRCVEVRGPHVPPFGSATDRCPRNGLAPPNRAAGSMSRDHDDDFLPSAAQTATMSGPWMVVLAGADAIGSIAELVRAHARERPGPRRSRPGSSGCTFAELDPRSNQVAGALVAAGVERRRSRRLSRQELAGVLRAAVRRQQGRRGHRAGELAARRRRRSPTSSTTRPPSVLVVGAEVRRRDRIGRRRAGRRCRLLVTLGRRAPSTAPSATRDWVDAQRHGRPGAPSRPPTTSPSSCTRRGRPDGRRGRCSRTATCGACCRRRRATGGSTPTASTSWRCPTSTSAASAGRSSACYAGASSVVLPEFAVGAVLAAIADARRHPRRARARRAPGPARCGERRRRSTSARCGRSSTAPRRSPRRVLAEAVRTFSCGFIQGYGLTETVGARDPPARRRPRPRGGPPPSAALGRPADGGGRGARRRAGDRRRRRRPAPSARSGCAHRG